MTPTHSRGAYNRGISGDGVLNGGKGRPKVRAAGLPGVFVRHLLCRARRACSPHPPPPPLASTMMTPRFRSPVSARMQVAADPLLRLLLHGGVAAVAAVTE